MLKLDLWNWSWSPLGLTPCFPLLDFKNIPKLNPKSITWSQLYTSQDLKPQMIKNLPISDGSKLQPGELPLCHPPYSSTGHIVSLPKDHLHVTSGSFTVHPGLGIAIGPHSSGVRSVSALRPWKRQFHGCSWIPLKPISRNGSHLLYYTQPLLLGHWEFGLLWKAERQSISTRKDFRISVPGFHDPGSPLMGFGWEWGREAVNFWTCRHNSVYFLREKVHSFHKISKGSWPIRLRTTDLL